MRKLVTLLLICLIGGNFLTASAFADWAHAFVVYDGNIYVISKTHIAPEQIGKKIGKVTKYSDMEGTYSGNFSNHYPKGTEYYEIKGIKILDAIAIKDSKGKFVRADYEGKYAGRKNSWGDFLPYLLGIIPLAGITYFFMQRYNKSSY